MLRQPKNNFFKSSTITIISILIILVFNGCDLYCNNLTDKGSVVITFDDRHIENWYIADSIFLKYNWKATFCVSGYHTLSDKQKAMLQILQNNGNEIASHSTNHYNAREYLSTHSMNEYLENEIFPSLNEMTSDNLKITSFVYPGGVRSVELDLALFDYFSVLRGTTYNKYSTMSGSHFLIHGSDKLLVYGLGIDNHYEHFSKNYIVELLKYAKDENIALILYGHNILDNDTEDYVTSFETIKLICEYVNNNDMQFLTLSELTSFNRID